MEAPGSGPAPPGVQVTRERVLAPPDRFLSLSDDVLLESFQGEPCTGYGLVEGTWPARKQRRRPWAVCLPPLPVAR